MIQFGLPYPISANRYWRTFVAGGRVVTHPSTEATQYKRDAAWIARGAGLVEPLEGPIEVELVLHPVEPKDAAVRARKQGPSWVFGVRCLDVDNAVKVALDALQGVAYANDKQIVTLLVQKGMPCAKGALSVRVSAAVDVELKEAA